MVELLLLWEILLYIYNSPATTAAIIIIANNPLATFPPVLRPLAVDLPELAGRASAGWGGLL